MTLRLEQCHQNWLINLSVLHQKVSREGYLHQKVSNYVNLSSENKHFIRIHRRFELIEINML